MRLIDADDFIKKFRTEDENIMCATVRRMIKEQPTAYDVDMVTEQLEDLKDENVCVNISCTLCKYTAKCVCGEMSENVAIDRAIEIVKSGGLNE